MVVIKLLDVMNSYYHWNICLKVVRFGERIKVEG